MNKTLNLNVIDCLDKIYGRMKDNYDFAFPDSKFSQNRAHQVLCRFGTFHATLNTLFDPDYMIPSNEVEKVFSQQMINHAKIIGWDKEWAYPNGSLSENHAPNALNCMDTSIKHYNNSLKLLGNYCFADKKANFDLLGFIENISCLNAYNYAYPNNYYNADKAHPAIQMLLTITENIIFIVDSVVTPNAEVKTIVSNYINQLESARKTLLKAYPNNEFSKELGHTCLGKFIDIWKNAKEVFVPNMKNYFEKQELIAEYEAKLNNKQEQMVTFPQYQHVDMLMADGNTSVVAIPIDNVIQEVSVEKKPVAVEESVIPVVKKIKSML